MHKNPQNVRLSVPDLVGAIAATAAFTWTIGSASSPWGMELTWRDAFTLTAAVSTLSVIGYRVLKQTGIL